MKFHVLQINTRALFKQSEEALSDYRQDPAKQAYLNASFGMDVKPAIELGLYEHVCDIEAENLDQVFEIGNLGPENAITRHKPMTSLSVGNLVVNALGHIYSCENVGWAQIDSHLKDKLPASAFARA